MMELIMAAMMAIKDLQLLHGDNFACGQQTIRIYNKQYSNIAIFTTN